MHTVYVDIHRIVVLNKLKLEDISFKLRETTRKIKKHHVQIMIQNQFSIDSIHSKTPTQILLGKKLFKEI